MTLQLVTALQTGKSEASDVGSGWAARLVAPSQGENFASALAKAEGKEAVVTVKPGDTLSGLIQKQLKALRSPVSLSKPELYRLAVQVAQANQIPDANRIYPNQKIDLSSLETWAMADTMQPKAEPQLAASDPVADSPRKGMPTGQGFQRDFLSQHASAASSVEATSGIPASFMMAQAALETGWGKREIKYPNGQTTHNLFGMRAGPNWNGPVAEIWTTEYKNGAPQRVKGLFRAYASYEESFNDYARLITQSPRYANAMRQLDNPQGFASALQQAGYATAPNYANVLTSMIQSTQRIQAASQPILAKAPVNEVWNTAQALRMRADSVQVSTLPRAVSDLESRTATYAYSDPLKSLDLP